MRLRLDLSGSFDPIPFSYQHDLIKRLHSWIGDNDYHDATSLYSVGWIRGDTIATPRGIIVTPKAYWEISAFEEEFINRIEAGIEKDCSVINGNYVKSMRRLKTPKFGNIYRFWAASPILVREKRRDGSKTHLSFRDGGCDKILTRILRWKLVAAGFSGNHLEAIVGFDRTYSASKMKVVSLGGVKSKGNLCPVIVQGTPEVVEFAYDVGVGHSTGSGFGQLIIS